MAYIASYERLPRDLDTVGVKALALAHMQDAQLTLPPWRVLTSAFSQHALGQLDEKARFVLDELSMQDAAKSLQSMIRQLTLPAELISILSEAYGKLTFNEYADQPVRRLAVRVSRTYLAEHDGHAVLGVKNVEQLVQAVKDVWAGEFTLEALKERAQKNLGLYLTRIPIILQQYIPPDATAYIYPRSETLYHIIAWKGVNTHRDMHTADHYIVNHEEQHIEKLLNNTPGEILIFSEEEDAIIPLTLSEEERAQPFLTPRAITTAVHQYHQSRDALHGTTLEFVTQGDRVVFITMKDTQPIRLAAEATLMELEKQAEPHEANPYTTPLTTKAEEESSIPPSSPAEDSRQPAAPSTPPPTATSTLLPEREAEPAGPSSPQPPSSPPSAPTSSPRAASSPSSTQPSPTSPPQALSEGDTAESASSGEEHEAHAPHAMSDEEIMREIEKAVSQLEALGQPLLGEDASEREAGAPREAEEGEESVEVTAEDVYRTVERLVEKYITINPDLERVFRHFLEDLREAYNK